MIGLFRNLFACWPKNYRYICNFMLAKKWEHAHFKIISPIYFIYMVYVKTAQPTTTTVHIYIQNIKNKYHNQRLQVPIEMQYRKTFEWQREEVLHFLSVYLTDGRLANFIRLANNSGTLPKLSLPFVHHWPTSIGPLMKRYFSIFLSFKHCCNTKKM